MLTKKFTAPLGVDDGYRNTPIADTASHTFTLIGDIGSDQLTAEWEVLDFYEVIGLWFQGKTLVDYDGVFELPVQLLDWLTELGYNVEEMREI
jgi:hypothetical protein